jgi:hypothetical protein
MTALEFSLTKAAERLLELATLPAARININETNPEDLEALLDLAKRLAGVIDPLFFGIAAEAGVVTPQDPYDRVVTSAIDGYLTYDLEKAADNIRDEEPCVDPNEEHRLGARQLGVGRFA